MKKLIVFIIKLNWPKAASNKSMQIFICFLVCIIQFTTIKAQFAKATQIKEIMDYEL